MTTQIKITQPFITQPDEIGEIIRETPKTIIVKIIKRTFESNTSGTGRTYKFSKGDKEWFGGELNFTRKFWKETGKEIGGETFIKK
jgi:hypothetical protein